MSLPGQCPHGHSEPTLCLECVTTELEETQQRLIETQLQLIGANDILINATMAAQKHNWALVSETLFKGPRLPEPLVKPASRIIN